MACDRRAGLGKACLGAILLLFTALVSVAAATTQDILVGKVPVGYSTTHQVCYCELDIPSGQSAEVTSIQISGTGASNYTITNDGCTGYTLSGQGTKAKCDSLSTTECQHQITSWACVYDIVADPAHPGPLPQTASKATVCEGTGCPNNGLTTVTNSYPLIATGGIIIAPADSTTKNPDLFALSTPQNSTDPGSASITFTAANLQAGDTIAWKTTTAYKPNVGKSVPNSVTSFNGAPNQSITQDFTGVGGKTIVNATAENYTDTATVYIVGPPSSSGGEVPYSLITSELDALYGGVDQIPAPLNGTCSASAAFVSFPTSSGDSTKTAGLMTQIATEESSYSQFVTQSLYGVSNFWPNGTGVHIGLMQVPTTMAHAWDWVQNAQDGADIPSQDSFQCKLGVANRIARKMEAGHPGLSLTACQLEEMAIALYAGLGHGQSGEYYTPQCVGGTGTGCKNGSWQWQINTKNLCAVCDVIAARNEVPLTGGSATSCQPPAGISADPPTDLIPQCCAASKRKVKVNMSDLGCPK